MKQPRTILLLLILFALSLSSCSVDKYLQPGQKVLYRNQIDLRMADSTDAPPEITQTLANMQQYYHQLPNKRFLFMRLKMRLYCSTNPTDSSAWARFWRNQGEPPVIYDPYAAQRTATQIATLLKTKGCFNSTVTTDTIHYGDNSLIARYNITATPRRKIDDITFSCRQPDVDSILKSWKDESLLKVGDYYDQQIMTQEQNRIASRLKDSGYYHVTPDLVRFYVDTTYDNQLLSIAVRLRLPQLQKGDSIIRNAPLLRYTIDNIYLYPNISTALNGPARQFDTLILPYRFRDSSITNYRFIYDKTITPSPRTIRSSVFFRTGQTYRPLISTITSNSLFGLHNFKYVDISYEESPRSTDTTPLLDVRIRLLNNTRHRLSLSFEVTNASNFSQSGNFITSGNLGLGTSIGYRNNNLFGGAEALNVEGSLLFDLPKNAFTAKQSDFYTIFSTFENSLNLTLDLPKFVLPFADRLPWQYNRPHTLVGLNAAYILRNTVLPGNENTPVKVTLERILFGGSFGYTWSHRRSHQHKLMPFNLTYTHIIKGNEYYGYIHAATNDLVRLLFQSYDYILLNTHYEYTYTNQVIGSRQNFSYLNISVETAGNLLSAISSLRPSNHTIDSHYYQYFRFEGEYKRYIYWGDKNTLVLRALAGIGIPYGHSQFIPYEKMFVGGGPTTMRGWGLRQLGGYGLYIPGLEENPFGIGEILFVGNIEQRFPIISIFEGALFTDIGNVWCYSDWGLGPQHKIDTRAIFKNIALDAGVGIRANISVITLRLDFAIPLYDPNYSPGNRWITSNWGWNKLTLNFGINYPF